MHSLGLVAIILFVSAVLSGAEIAYLASNKFNIELKSRQGKWSARILSLITANQSRFIATLLVAFNIALVVYGMKMSGILEPFLSPWLPSPFLLLSAQTIISTLLVLVAVEFIPKFLFLIAPNRVLEWLAVPLWMIYFILFPVVILIMSLSRFLLTVFFNITLPETKPVFGRVDLNHYLGDFVEKSKGKEVETEVRLFHNALSFNETRLRKCMIPKEHIVSMEADGQVEDLRKKFVETQFSRLLIYEKSPEKIIGYIHSYEMFKLPSTIRSVLLPLLTFTEDTSAKEALALMIKEHKTIATVTGEAGNISGMVTVEDIIEEIVGEIEDEHDK